MGRLVGAASHDSQNIPSWGAQPRNFVSREYTPFGQVATETQDHRQKGLQPLTVGYFHAGRVLFQSQLDTNSIRLERVEYPGGKILTYGYDAGADDALSRVTLVQEAQQGATGFVSKRLAHYGYWGAANFYRTNYLVHNGFRDRGAVPLTSSLTKNPYRPGSTVFAAMDDHDRLEDLALMDGRLAKVKERVTYQHDENSLRTKRGIQTLTCDDLNRLRTFGQPGLGQGWRMDAAGNWEAFVEVGSTTLKQARSHTVANRISGIGGGWAQPAYDKNGNLTAFPSPKDPTEALQAKYDAWNRLVKISRNGEAIAKYDYDALNRRIGLRTYSEGEVLESRRFFSSPDWQLLEPSEERVTVNRDIGNSTTKSEHGHRRRHSCALRGYTCGGLKHSRTRPSRVRGRSGAGTAPHRVNDLT